MPNVKPDFRQPETLSKTKIMSNKKTKIHLFTGFLGTGKTTAIRSLIAQKPDNEKWLIIVNEFGEIGIDGAVLAENGIPVGEISGGCLCCSAGAQMDETVRQMLAQHQPERILIEASGLAHAASVMDELKTAEFTKLVDIAAVFTLVDPRQFIDPNFSQNPLYRDQVSACDVLVATKIDLCTPEQLTQFQQQAQQLFPAKSLIVETENAQLQLAWLETPIIAKPRYRVRTLPENTLGYQSQGYTFPAGQNFDVEKLSLFFNELPNLVQGLVRAKGVFQVMDTWVWLNWVDGSWGANQVAWRRDSRFELIAQSFDADSLEHRLRELIE